MTGSEHFSGDINDAFWETYALLIQYEILADTAMHQTLTDIPSNVLLLVVNHVVDAPTHKKQKESTLQIRITVFLHMCTDVKKHTVRVCLTIRSDKLNISYVQMEHAAFIHNSCHQRTSLETLKATQTHYHMRLYH